MEGSRKLHRFMVTSGPLKLHCALVEVCLGELFSYVSSVEHIRKVTKRYRTSVRVDNYIQAKNNRI
jgi:hypothetical protein